MTIITERELLIQAKDALIDLMSGGTRYIDRERNITIEFDYTEAQKVIANIDAVLAAPATAPAWHGAPTCAGLWFCDEGDENPYRFTCHNVSIPLNPYLVGEGERWYGPIPPDGDKP